MRGPRFNPVPAVALAGTGPKVAIRFPGSLRCGARREVSSMLCCLLPGQGLGRAFPRVPSWVPEVCV